MAKKQRFLTAKYMESHNTESWTGLLVLTISKPFISEFSEYNEEKSQSFTPVIQSYINSLCLRMSDCLKFNNQKCK